MISHPCFRIAADHPCLDGHFPNAPVVPGVVVLDRVIEAVAAAGLGTVVGIARCKFVSALFPGETCTIELFPEAAAGGGSARFVCRGPDGPLVQGVLTLAAARIPDDSGACDRG